MKNLRNLLLAALTAVFLPALHAEPGYESFSTFPAGAYPSSAGLVSDGAGYLWGTTKTGGASGYGSVFKVSESGDGTVITVLSFTDNGASNKGREPMAGLLDDGGFFWGTTRIGGTSSLGTVFKINKTTGALTTIVNFTGTSGSFKGSEPHGKLALDSSGNIWGTTKAGGTGDKGTVFKISKTTDVTMVASGIQDPYGLVFDSSGNLYVDSDRSILKYTTAFSGSNFAGLTGTEGSANGTGTAARFRNPQGLAVDGSDNLYMTQGNGDYTIRKITTPGAVVTTLAGLLSGTYDANSGYVDGAAADARFGTSGNGPVGVAVYNGYLFVADRGNNRIRKVSLSDGTTSTLAGSGSAGGADGTGTAATFHNPTGLSVDANGNLYVGDWGRNAIRKVTQAGVVTTLAGSTSGSNGTSDGTGTAARFNEPSGTAVDPYGNVYVCDYNNHTIRKITPAGVVTTLAGLAGNNGSTNGSGTSARFNFPSHITVDAVGDLFVSDRANGQIRKITFTPNFSTVVEFTGTTGGFRGQAPMGGLLADATSGKIWGTTQSGGKAGDYGTVFTVETSTSYFATVAEFTGVGGVCPGQAPTGDLYKDSATEMIWGTTQLGSAGADNKGTIFKIPTGVVPVTDFSFESPAQNVNGMDGRSSGSAGFGNQTTAGAWTFAGNAAVGANGSPYVSTSTSIGTQCLVVLGSGSTATQTLTGLTGGRSYRLTFAAAQRSHNQVVGASATWRVSVSQNGGAFNEVRYFDPSMYATSYVDYICDFTAGSTSTQLRFEGVRSGDYTVLIDNLRIQERIASNNSFEIDQWVGDNNFVKPGNNGKAWTFASAGIAGINSGFGNGSPSPDGSQVAIVQLTDEFYQTISGLVVGRTYKIAHTVKTRNCCGGGTYDPTWDVQIDGTPIASFDPGYIGSYTNYYTEFVASATSHVLKFKGTNTHSRGDVTLFMDNIRVNDASQAINVRDFTGTSGSYLGANPYGGLTTDGTDLFGATYAGGTSDLGTVFKITTGGTFTNLASLTGASGAALGRNPGYGSIIKHTDGHFYGTTMGSTAATGDGRVYRLRVGPSPVTTAATSVGATSATLNATVNPNGYGSVTNCRFEWGTSPTLSGATSTSNQTVANGTSPVAINAGISGLTLNNTYYYRVVAPRVSDGALQYGAIMSFVAQGAAITSVTPPSNGSYKAGTNLDFTVNFSESVTVTGSPYLSLNIGGVSRNAAYVSGSPGTALLFRYTVAADTDTDGIASSSPLVLNSGTINATTGGNPAILTFTPPNTTGVLVDTTAPSVSSVTGPSNGSYKAGDVLSFTVNFNEAVTVASGTPTFALTVGATGRTASYVSGSGSSALVFSYTVQAGETDTDGIASASPIVLGGTIRDAATNNASLTFTPPNTTGVLVDTTAPTVTINQAGGQVDPTNGATINFTVVFSEATTNFATGDVTLGGTAGATTGTVTGSGTTYNVAVTGMTGSGTVIASLGAGVATDAAGNGNAASTSTDNTVTRDVTAPTVTINQAGGQVDPTNGATINFTVVFSEATTNFATGDVTLGGTAGATTGTVTGSGTTYNVAVTGMTGDGTVIASLGAGVATDAAGNGNAASTSTDNTVTRDVTAPTVTINQAGGQVDPTNGATINFTVVFSEATTNFATGDVTLGGTAGATTGTVTGSGTTYNVAVTGMTGDGTVIASLGSSVATDAAGNGNAASTSTDNTVTRDTTAPTVTINQAGGQSDPTNGSPINFTVVFSEATTTFATGDVTLGGTTGGTKVGTVTGSGTTYNVAVTGMTGEGTVIASLGASVATDAAGNGNAASTSTDNTVTRDTVAPSAPSVPDLAAGSDSGSSSTDNITNVTTPTFTGTAEAGSTVKIYDGVTLVGTGTATGGNYSIAVSTLSTGSRTMTATATDPAGNVSSSSSSLVIVIDTTAPAAPSIPDLIAASDSGTSSTDNITNDTTPTFDGTMEAGTTVKIYDGVTLVGSGTGATGTGLFGEYYDSRNVGNPSNFTTGPIDFTRVDATVNFNWLGNIPGGTMTDSDNFSVRWTGTVTPTTTENYTFYGGSDDGVRLWLNGSLIVDQWVDRGHTDSPSAPIAVVAGVSYPIVMEYYQGGGGTSARLSWSSTSAPTMVTIPQSALSPAGIYSITTSTLAAGTRNVTATATDLAGNVSSASSALSVTIDTSAPFISSVTGPSNGSYRAGQNLDFTVNFNENVTVAGGTPSISLTVGATARNATYVSGTGTSALLFRYTVQAGETDSNGIASASPLVLNGATIRDAVTNDTTLTFTPPTTTSVLVDTTAPTAAITYSPTGSVKAGTSLTITATFNEPLLDSPVVQLAISGSNTLGATNMTKTSSTVYTYVHTVGAGNGAATVAMSVGTDVAGNVITSAPTSGATFTVDNTSPTAAITYSPTGPVKAGTALTITATFSEAIADAPVMRLAISGSNTLAATNMTKTSSTVYTYVHTVGAGNGAATVAMSVGTDVPGNVVTSAPTSGATFTVDNSAPTLSPVTIASNNANTSLAKTGNTITLSFTSSEAIQTPTVTLAGIAATMANPSGNNWTATVTVAASTAEGVAAIGISFADLAGNIGLPGTTAVPLQNTAAIFSQGGWNASNTIDGNFGSGNGWADDTGAATSANTIVWETVSDINANANTEFTFTFTHAFGTQHSIGRFRLSATTDARSTFADSLNNGGDVTANWTVLQVVSFLGSGGEIGTVQGDNSILVSGTIPATTTYTVRVKGIAGLVSGFRLEVMEDASLPTNGPGMHSANGNFVLNELGVGIVSTTNSSSVTVDNTAPTLSPVTIVSNNANTALAKSGDVITLSFTSSETIATPTVTIAGQAATVSNPSGNNWTGTITVNGSTTQGVAAIAITFADSVGNAGSSAIPLRNTSAFVSQGGGWNASNTVDGDTSAGNGWAGLNGSSVTVANTIVWETASNIAAVADTEFTFTMTYAFGSSHSIGRFRISATTDPRSDFADGVQNGGDVTANWTVLTPVSFSCSGGGTGTTQGDNSILLSGTNPATTVYTVRVKGIVGNVTGFRLEAMEDASLPDSGPGRAANGNYVLNELSASVVWTTNASTVTVDRSAPSAPSTPDLAAGSDSGSSNSDNITNVTTPTFTGTAESGSTVKIYDGVTLVGTGTATGGNYSIAVSALTPGSRSITATATDPSGNVSSSSSALVVILDTTAPAAPSIPDLLAASDTGVSNTDNYTGDDTPTFTGTMEAGATVIIYAGGTPVGSGSSAAGTGLYGEWYDNDNLTAPINFTRVDSTVNFNWNGSIPGGTMTDDDFFSVRWSGRVTPQFSETYTFYTMTDDGARLWVNGVQLVNHWLPQGDTEHSGSIALTGGVAYDIVMEYFQGGGGETAELRWSSVSTPKAIIPQSALTPAGAYAITTSTLSSNTHNITATATDVAGNISAATSALSVIVDTTPAVITSVTPPANGSYAVGQSLNFTVNFDGPVTVAGGTPSMTLTVGATARNATYFSGSGTSALVFRYQVQVGENDSDGVVLASPVVLNGATVRDPLDVNAALTFTSPNTTGVLVDNTPPTAVITYSPSGPVKSGTNLTITATFNEPMADAPVVNLEISGVNTLAPTAMTKTSTTVYTYTHTVGAGNGTASVELSVGVDRAGNNIITTPTSGATFTVDNTVPTAAITYSPSDGMVRAGDSLTITATFNEVMADAPVVRLAIGGANTLGATNMTKTSGTVYTYVHTVGAGNGAATVTMSVGTDLAGNVIASAPTSGATFTVDNTPPVLDALTNLTVEAKTLGGELATFAPTATDNLGSTFVVCTPASGSLFPLGVTTVNVTVTDSAGNVGTPGSFTVTVADTIPPTLTLLDQTVEATEAGGAYVTFPKLAADIVSNNLTVNSTPASGSFFPLGTTTVNVSAQDPSGNISNGSFQVTVRNGWSYEWANYVGQPGGTGNADGTGAGASFSAPIGAAVDASGNVYVADSANNTVRKITSAGVVTTLAGRAGFAGKLDGTGSAARFRVPAGVAVDGSGNVYVADQQNHTIRKITSAGVVTTLAGSGGVAGSANGTGSAARFDNPTSVAVDGSGNVYVADSGNNTIRKVTSAGVVTTLAGLAGSTGSTDATGSSARFTNPSGVAVESGGANIYVADQDNHTIRKVTSAGVVTTLAGTAGSAGRVNATGAAARFEFPRGVAVAASGDVYVADSSNQLIRKVTSGGVVTSVAGFGGTSGIADGTGTAARFNSPVGIAVESGGANVYVADSLNDKIRKVVTASGVVTTLAGSAWNAGTADSTVSTSTFNTPTGIGVDSSGNTYVAEWQNHTIRKITPGGIVTTLAGSAGNSGAVNGIGSAARFNNPRGLTVDSSGNVFVADYSNHVVRKITPAGVVSTFAGAFGSSGSTNGSGGAARFNNPANVVVDSTGNVYVADYGNSSVRKINSVGAVSTLATGLGAVHGVALDGSGNVYTTDFNNHVVRKITSTGTVTVLAGSSGVAGSIDGTGAAARFNGPISITGDGSGNLFVSDTGNNSIRKIVAATGVATTVSGYSPGINVTDYSFESPAVGSGNYQYTPGGTAWTFSGAGVAANSSTFLGAKVAPAGTQAAFIQNGGYMTTKLWGLIKGRTYRVNFAASQRPGNTQTWNVSIGSTPNVGQIDPGVIGSFNPGAGTNAFDEYSATFVASNSVPTLTFTGTNTGGDNSILIDNVRVTEVTTALDGNGTVAQFNAPQGIVADSSGNIYIADTGHHTIRKLATAPVITTTPPVAVHSYAKQLIGNNFTVSSADLINAGQPTLDPVTPQTNDYDVQGPYDLPTPWGGIGVLTDGTYTNDPSAAALRKDLKPFSITYKLNTDLSPYGYDINKIMITTAEGGPTRTDLPDGLHTHRAAQAVTILYRLVGESEFVSIKPENNTVFNEGQTNPSGAPFQTNLLTPETGTHITPRTQPGSLGFLDGSQIYNEWYGDWQYPGHQLGHLAEDLNRFGAKGPIQPHGGEFQMTVNVAGLSGVAEIRFETTYASGNTSGFGASAYREFDVFGAITSKVTTIAGVANTAGSADTTVSAAWFNNPTSVAVDGFGNAYVADCYNHTIRKITAGGITSTMAGTAGTSGSANGTGTAAMFFNPSGVAVDTIGNVFVADQDNHTIRKITPAGVVTTLAGSAGVLGNANGTGSAARFNFPASVAIDGSGNLYVADSANHTIRKIVVSTGVVTTLVGTSGSSGTADGTGTAARFTSPNGVAVDIDGNIYVADTFNQTIRKVTPAGVVTTIAGSGGLAGSTDGTGSAARFKQPTNLAVSASGMIYVADHGNSTIRRVTPAGVVTTVGGTAGIIGSVPGLSSSAAFSGPTGVAVSSTGLLYVADTNNNRITRGIPTTTFQIWANQQGLVEPNSGLSDDGDGDGDLNLLEYAFGTNPHVSTNTQLLAFVQGGAVTQRGKPITTGTGPYFASFARRADYIAAGLVYTVQFTTNMTDWFNSPATPTVNATDGVIDAVSVPFLDAHNIFRVVVTQTP